MTRFVAAVLLALLFPSASGQTPRDLQLNLPSAGEIGKALSTLCALQAQGAKIGFQAREAGASLAEVLTRLPTNPDPAFKRTLEAFRETIEDSFTYPDIGYFTMFFFRATTCYREITELQRMPGIATSIEYLRSCQSKHGKESSPELLGCVRGTVDALPLPK